MLGSCNESFIFRKFLAGHSSRIKCLSDGGGFVFLFCVFIFDFYKLSQYKLIQNNNTKFFFKNDLHTLFGMAKITLCPPVFFFYQNLFLKQLKVLLMSKDSITVVNIKIFFFRIPRND